jgi:hypothetical protein
MLVRLPVGDEFPIRHGHIDADVEMVTALMVLVLLLDHDPAAHDMVAILVQFFSAFPDLGLHGLRSFEIAKCDL